MRGLLCWALGHGPWGAWVLVWHEGELRRGRRCQFCGCHIELAREVLG